ncbi:matrix metalloproteinase-2 [Drosophila erecta]|uniref:matrix metalloproteinase-2 n=1 Tax=Drosophila erecta TaxID=7220 RepID=UPI000F06143A|nr:matrix metalloproteinase-2 [Drosophila erecta]
MKESRKIKNKNAKRKGPPSAANRKGCAPPNECTTKRSLLDGMVNQSMPDAYKARMLVTRALSVWEYHSKLTFREVYSDQADIQILFARRQHGDGYQFDGPGQVLAHAFYPSEGRGGDAHFDADETWNFDSGTHNRRGTNFLNVALHELGHSLGLGHSSDPKAVMFAWYQDIDVEGKLPDDDRNGIQELYGSREKTWGPYRPQTTPTTTTTTTMRTMVYRADNPPYRPWYDPSKNPNKERNWARERQEEERRRKEQEWRRQEQEREEREREEQEREKKEREEQEREEEEREEKERKKQERQKQEREEKVRQERRRQEQDREEQDNRRRERERDRQYEKEQRERHERQERLNRERKNRERYGVRAPVTPPSTTTMRPTRKPYYTIVHQQNHHHKKQRKLKPDTCMTSYDAISMIRSELFIFRGPYLWRIGKSGLYPGYPTEIRRQWSALPVNLTQVDAVYENQQGHIVFFIGRQYYVFNSVNLEPGYPKPLVSMGLPPTLTHIDAAFVWGHNNHTFLTSDTLYWRIDDNTGEVEPSYPRDMSLWSGVGYKIDAAFQYKDGKTYFFKNLGYWEFDDDRMKVAHARPKLSAPKWMQCARGSNEVDDELRWTAPLVSAENEDGETGRSGSRELRINLILISILLLAIATWRS